MEMVGEISLTILCFYFFLRMAIIWGKNEKLIEDYWIKKKLPFLNKDEENIIQMYKNYYRGFVISGFILGMILFLDL